MIAYHMPPCAEVSGALRTLSLADELAAAGYQPIILAPKPLAYPKRFPASSPGIAEQYEVQRTLALDAARHMGLLGRYPEFLARPDRWVSWWFSAVPRGLALIRRFKPKAIWSTYPIATSHLIASTLHRRTGIPWIADFRDPMVLPAYPIPPATLAARERLERETVQLAHTCVFVTQRSLAMYASRYSDMGHGGFELVPNGYDEEAFAAAEDQAGLSVGGVMESERPVVLVHSGLLYPTGRNPRPFFEALANLLKQGRLSKDVLRVVLHASGTGSNYDAMVAQYGLHGVVQVAPMLTRQDALAEQYQADGALLFQGAEFNAQVPAKLYEYFRVGKPILALADPSGETAELVLREKAGFVVDPNDVQAIETCLLEFVGAIRKGGIAPVQGDALLKYSREMAAQKFVSLVDRIVRAR